MLIDQLSTNQVKVGDIADSINPDPMKLVNICTATFIIINKPTQK